MRDKQILILGLSYLFYFAMLGALVPFMGVFLDSRGLTSVEIGQLLSLITITRILGPNLWAFLADKTGKNLRVLQLGSFLTLAGFSVVYVSFGFWSLTLAFSLFMLFWTAVLPQIEVITLNNIEGNPARYSRIRLWGSIGYILFSVVGGFVIDWNGPGALLYLCSIILLGLFLSTLFVKDTKVASKPSDALESMWKMISAWPFVAFMLSAILLQVSFGPFYSFFALYMRDIGYTGQQTGWLIALGVAAEVFIFIYAGKLINRFGVKSVMLFCIGMTALRWWLLASAANVLTLLIFSQLIHALSFGLTHSASIHFIHRYFTGKYQTRGQALYTSVSFGVGGAVGNLIAGQIWMQGQGAFNTYLFSTFAALASAIILLIIPRARME
ncbi:MFS transporter [Alteromonadaceae bacterium M269]|nr:MFS transporter [Alteromonadaceae bacterium M269]